MKKLFISLSCILIVFAFYQVTSSSSSTTLSNNNRGSAHEEVETVMQNDESQSKTSRRALTSKTLLDNARLGQSALNDFIFQLLKQDKEATLDILAQLTLPTRTDEEMDEAGKVFQMLGTSIANFYTQENALKEGLEDYANVLVTSYDLVDVGLNQLVDKAWEEDADHTFEWMNKNKKTLQGGIAQSFYKVSANHADISSPKDIARISAVLNDEEFVDEAKASYACGFVLSGFKQDFDKSIEFFESMPENEFVKSAIEAYMEVEVSELHPELYQQWLEYNEGK